MTEKQVERDLQSLGNYLKAYDPRAESIHYAYVRLIIHLYEERAAQRKQAKIEDNIVSAGEVTPNEPDLYEVVCPKGVSSLRARDVVRLHSLTTGFNKISHFFVRQSDFSTHPIKKDTDAPYVLLRKLESLETKSIE